MRRKKRGARQRGGRCPVCGCPDSTHVRIINSDCSMVMYIRVQPENRSNACCVLLRTIVSSCSSYTSESWQIQITWTKARFLFIRDAALGTAMKIHQTMFYAPTNRAVCFLQFARGYLLFKLKTVYREISRHVGLQGTRSVFSNQIPHAVPYKRPMVSRISFHQSMNNTFSSDSAIMYAMIARITRDSSISSRNSAAFREITLLEKKSRWKNAG